MVPEQRSLAHAPAPGSAGPEGGEERGRGSASPEPPTRAPPPPRRQPPLPAPPSPRLCACCSGAEPGAPRRGAASGGREPRWPAARAGTRPPGCGRGLRWARLAAQTRHDLAAPEPPEPSRAKVAARGTVLPPCVSGRPVPAGGTARAWRPQPGARPGSHLSLTPAHVPLYRFGQEKRG